MTEQPEGSSGGGRRAAHLSILGGLLTVAVIAGAVAWQTTMPLPSAPSAVAGAQTVAAAPMARRETRPTLDPARFVGKAALAHQVAREIPGTLDQLYCYCECDKHQGHKSLLSCYTDGHAAT